MMPTRTTSPRAFLGCFSLYVSLSLLALKILKDVDAGQEVGFERPIVDDFFEGPREVQGFEVEVSLLCFAEEVLDSYVHDVE